MQKTALWGAVFCFCVTMLSFVSFHFGHDVICLHSDMHRSHVKPQIFKMYCDDLVRKSEKSTISRYIPKNIETLQIGIDPRAASATRALLRLTPCYRAYLRTARGDTSGTPGSLELTGGEYKT